MTSVFETSGISKETFLYSLLEAWHKVLKEYEDKMYQWDLGYSHGERTNIGLLAVAAAKKSCLVLEEFSCRKKHGRQQRSGRADLWIIKDVYTDYRFEAKRITPNVKTKIISKEVRKALKKALGDIKEIPLEDRPTKSAGIVFVIPYIPKRTQYDLDSIKHELLDLKSLDAHFSAVHFCKQEIERLKYRTPCIAVIGRWHKW